MIAESFNRMNPIRRVRVADQYAGKQVKLTILLTGRGEKHTTWAYGSMVGGAATNSKQSTDVVILRNAGLHVYTGASVREIMEVSE